jgi:hypothetical protein
MVAAAPHRANPVAALVRRRIEAGGDRVWRFEDFDDLPWSAVAQTLSRLARTGAIERLSKGTYYRPRATVFGPSRPNATELRGAATRAAPLFPAGIAAANLLGFTEQVPARGEVATVAGSVPRKLVGADTVVHTRRPAAWRALTAHDAALLDVIRRRGRTSAMTPEGTVRRARELLAERGRFRRLAAVCGTEPPRVRAVLGALGESLGQSPAVLRRLRASLNPLSRFDFGAFGALPNAAAWQARSQRP